MTAITAQARRPVFARRLRPGPRSVAIALTHAALSRVIFHGAFLIGAALKAAQFRNDVEVPVPASGQLWRDLIRSILEYGDFSWYLSVSLRGYDRMTFSATEHHNWAFFPGFPLLIHILGQKGVALVVTQAAFFAAVWLLHDVIAALSDRRRARATLLLLVYFPMSYTVSEFRPETFLLFFMALALRLAQLERRWGSGLAGLAAGAFKPNAFLVSLLLWDGLPGGLKLDPRRWSSALAARLRDRPAATTFMLAAPLAGVVLLSLHLAALTGDPLAWVKIQRSWGADPGALVKQAALLVTHPVVIGREGWDFTMLNWAALALAAAGCASLLAARRWGWAVYVVLYASMTLVNFGVFTLGKHLATCFPMFLGLALLLRGRERTALLSLAFGAGLALNGLLNAMALDFTRP